MVIVGKYMEHLGIHVYIYVYEKGTIFDIEQPFSVDSIRGLGISMYPHPNGGPRHGEIPKY